MSTSANPYAAPRAHVDDVFEQGGTQTVVARGNADGYYQFQVDIAIPQTADPGGARLVARATDEEQARERAAVKGAEAVSW